MNSINDNGSSSPWLDDIENSRDLNRNEKQQFGFLVAWLESWRIQRRLPACRETCRRFSSVMVLAPLLRLVLIYQKITPALVSFG